MPTTQNKSNLPVDYSCADSIESKDVKTPEVKCDECGRVIPEDEVEESEIIGLVDEKIHICHDCESKFRDKMNKNDNAQPACKCDRCGEPIPRGDGSPCEVWDDGKKHRLCTECCEVLAEMAIRIPLDDDQLIF